MVMQAFKLQKAYGSLREAPEGRALAELAPPQAETEGARRQVRCCFAPIKTCTENRYGILPPLKGLGGFAAVAVGYADSSRFARPSGVPEGAIGARCFEDAWNHSRRYLYFISGYCRGRHRRERSEDSRLLCSPSACGPLSQLR